MNLIWKLLLTTTLTLSGFYMQSVSAQTNPSLSGRWELTDEVQPDDDVITSIQFEKGQRMIFETIENNIHFIREAVYAILDGELIISMADDEAALPFLLSNSSLSLELNSSQTLNFARSQSLRQYHRFAIDTSTGNYLTVSDIKLDIQINGSQALTTVTYEIFNGGNDDAEAELNIPLPSSAQVIGYALDIQGVMVDGVIVPKEDARNAFNTIESKSIDPGIAEITKGNGFRTEIYPILPRNSRTIRIEYIETLDSLENDQVRYRFPLSRYSTAGVHDVAITVNGASSHPNISNDSAALAGTKFNANGDEYSLGFRLNNRLKKTTIPDLEFSFFPQIMQHPTRTRFKDGKAYFSITQQLENADFKAVKSKTNSVAVFWDASTSMEVHHQSNLNLLTAFINQNSISDKAISITIFANEILDTQVFTPSENRNQSILSLIDDLTYDGGTRFGAISQELSRHTTDYGLLFSDGIGSIGNYGELTPSYPLYTLTSEGAIDEPFLRQLATRSNGLFLKNVNGRYDRLLSFIGKQAPEINLTLSDKRRPGNLHYELSFGKTVALNISGTVYKSSATLATAINRSRFKKIRFSKTIIDEGGLTKHQWARMALNKLLVNRLKNENNIRDFGLTHSLITPFTSLIVLERIEDYAEYGIEPSPTLPYADEYPALRKEVLLERQVTKRTEEKTIQELLYQWEFRTLWWKLENPTTLKAALQAYTPPIEIQDSRGGFDLEEVMVTAMMRSEETNSFNVVPWSPDTVYLAELKTSSAEEQFATYIQLKKNFGDKPSFYMDCAQFFFQNQQGGIAKRVLSNVLELNPEQPIFSRMVAYNLLEFGYYDQAIEILRDIAKVLPYEPRSYRDLALAFETIATIQDDDTALKKALNMYYKAIMIDGELDDSVRITALTELNNLIPLAKSKNIRFNKLDDRLKLLMDLDIRVVLSWNNRMTDVDLWTIEPTGEKVFYNNVKGEGGGYLPQDVTTGYGPEEYLNRFSIPGAYKFKAHFYSNGSVEAFGPVTLSMNVYKNYGRENQSVHTATFRIEREEGVVDLGELIIGESKTNLNPLKGLSLDTSNPIDLKGR